MQKITPHLWFDKEAKEAAEFYVSTFPQSKIKSIMTLHDTPSGSVDSVVFELLGEEFQAISAGPLFHFNPSISFHVACRTKDDVDALFERLSAGGGVLMELGAYPFSERYGWLVDKYGLSWQINFVGADATPAVTPVIMFVGNLYGKLEEALNFWKSVFRDAKIGSIMRRGPGEEPEREGTISYAAFSLLGQEFGAMESGLDHRFALNEAISLMVNCESQEEIDYYWSKLSAEPEAEQCGWLKDKYGLSWQIVPVGMEEMLFAGDRERVERVTQAFMQMKKIDIAMLQAVFAGQ